MGLLAMCHNHIQVGDLSSGTRMATLPMSNAGPITTPRESANDLYGLPDTTLCTTMPCNHYPNYTMANHKGSTGTPRTSDAPYLLTCPWKSFPLLELKYSTGHTNVSESPFYCEAMALQCAQQGGWWEFFAHQSFFVIRQNCKTKQLLIQSFPIPPTSWRNQDLTVYRKSQNGLHIL